MAKELSALEQTTHQILRAFTKKEKSSEIAFEDFIQYLERYVRHYKTRFRQLEVFSGDMRVKAIRALRGLAESDQCKLHSLGTSIEKITFPHYFAEAIRDTYKSMESSADIPFPNERAMGLAVPADMITTVNVSTDLPSLIHGREQPSPIVRVLFPDNTESILVTPELIKSSMLDFAIAKLRHYLGQSNNAAYIQQRIVPAFSNNQVAVGEMMNTIVVKPATAKHSVEECSDFHFRFWAQLTNLIIQESRTSNNEAVISGNVQHAAHLIAAYNLAYRNASQKKQSDIKSSLRAVEEQFRKPPFVYTLSDLYGLKSTKGVPLIDKSAQEAFLGFLKDRVTPPAGKAVPEILRVQTLDRKEYFIHREMVIPVFLRMMPEVAQAVDEYYVESWSTALRTREKNAAMLDDEAFLRDVTKRVEYDHPLFNRLMNSDLLNGVQREGKLTGKLSMDIAKCFDRRDTKLKQVTELLDLDRKEIIKRVKADLPVWSRVAILRIIAGLFRALFGRRSGETRRSATARSVAPPGSARKVLGPAAPDEMSTDPRSQVPEASVVSAAPKGKQMTLKQSRAYHGKTVVALKEHFCGKERTLPESLKELSDKWNPLYEEKARADLIEDVNSMVRSFMRGILRRGVKPPDSQRIVSLTERLSQNPSFARIRKKDLFREYIQIYMVKLLADQYGLTI